MREQFIKRFENILFWEVLYFIVINFDENQLRVKNEDKNEIKIVFWRFFMEKKEICLKMKEN